jgi:hypothetical protein
MGLIYYDIKLIFPNNRNGTCKWESYRNVQFVDRPRFGNQVMSIYTVSQIASGLGTQDAPNPITWAHNGASSAIFDTDNYVGMIKNMFASYLRYSLEWTTVAKKP